MASAYKEQYAWEWQKLRREARANFVDGTPCPMCGRPMRVWQSLDLDHTIPVVYGGGSGRTRLTHSYCNRRAGALIGNRSPKRNRNGSRIGRQSLNRSAIKEGGTTARNGSRQLPKW